MSGLALVLAAAVATVGWAAAEEAETIPKTSWEKGEWTSVLEALQWKSAAGAKVAMYGLIGGVVVGTAFALVITHICIKVLEGKMERDRARFLDTRIQQFVDKEKGAMAEAWEDPVTGREVEDDVLDGDSKPNAKPDQP